MSQFDPKAFGQAALQEIMKGAKPALLDAIVAAKDLQNRLVDLGKDVEATLIAIQAEKDPARLALLQEDMDQTLPSRRASILSAARSRVSSDAAVALETALVILEKAALIAAKSFVTVL